SRAPGTSRNSWPSSRAATPSSSSRTTWPRPAARATSAFSCSWASSSSTARPLNCSSLPRIRGRPSISRDGTVERLLPRRFQFVLLREGEHELAEKTRELGAPNVVVIGDQFRVHLRHDERRKRGFAPRLQAGRNVFQVHFRHPGLSPRFS